MAVTMTLSSTVAVPEPLTSPSIHEKPERKSYGLKKPSKPLTLNFPVLTPTSQLDREQPPSPKHTTLIIPVRGSPRLPPIASSPTEPSSFLTSLAAQERRVLELREELHKAEADLSLLKTQWASHEAGRKKNELRHVERLQALPVTPKLAVDAYSESGANPAAALRASLENGTDRPLVRKSTQRVFSGSRHTRALSLLSPGAIDNQSARPRAFEEALSPTVTTTDIHSEQPPLSRSSTISSAEHNVDFGRTYKQLAGRRSMPAPARDLIVNSGKKMAADLREGLATFFEDIRQATVGDEAINGMQTRMMAPARPQKQSARSRQQNEPISNRKTIGEGNKKEKRRKEDEMSKARRVTDTPPPSSRKDESFWKEFGLETPSNKDRDIVAATDKSEPEPDRSLSQIDDSWDMWDSPIPPQDSSEHDLLRKKNPQPDSTELAWPELTKLTPLRLSRTVSDLMKEWESPAVTSRTSPSGLDDQAVASPHI